MKTTLRYGLSTLVLVIFSFTSTLGQNWLLRSTPDFNYYYHEANKSCINELDSLFRNDLYALQKKLNYFVNQPIDIFIFEKESEARSLQTGLEINEDVSGGVISLLPKKITVHLGLSYHQLSNQFKEVATAILLEEMMYGINLQDRVRNANLIHLPPWVIPGLVHYLSDNWSVETDNEWRMVYDEYGLDNFNTIPSKYDPIKGASFWKYIAHKYGDNAIPTMLYMARLTRKFSSASYYSFQVSIGEIYQEWKKYYTRAYSFDQQKPNPVHGLKMDIDEVAELLVTSQNSFYSLETKGVGYSLYRTTIQPPSRKKLLTLKKDEFPMAPFSGALITAGEQLNLFVNGKHGVVRYVMENNAIQKRAINLNYVTSCSQFNDQIFILVSNETRSRLYELNSDTLNLIYQQKGYIKSFDINGFLAVIVTEHKANTKFEIINLKSGKVGNSINLVNQKCKQALFANDTTILFNSDKNGIWNGKMWSTSNNRVEEVTNYRSNIAFHDYSDAVFVEYLDRGDNSSLFITEHLETNEFYKYDTLVPAYFFHDKQKSTVPTNLDSIRKSDTLESYSFQSPINPKFDFTLSNYDSLVKESVKKRNSNNIEVQALDLFKPAQLVVQLSNKLLMDETIGFQEALPYHTPNNLNLRLSSKYVNQYNTKSISIAYQGLLQAFTHDVSLRFVNTKKFNYEISVLHRQRNLFDEEKRNRYAAEILTLSHQDKLNNLLNYSVTTTTRLDRNISLATDGETMDWPNQKKVISLLDFEIEAQERRKKLQWTAAYNIAPHYSFLNSGWNITTGLDFSLDYQINSWLKFYSASQARTSFGSNPMAFVLGGQNQDILANYFDRNFSESKESMLFNLVYAVRGFSPNYRNGSTYFIANFDLSLKPMHKIISKPLVSEVFSNLEVIPFVDIATSFYGKGIYDKANSLNKVIINSSTGTIQAEVSSFKNPLIGAIGMGIGSQVYSYKLRFDMAYGIEEGKMNKPVYHLRIGYTL